jgi:hypothetical protein
MSGAARNWSNLHNRESFPLLHGVLPEKPILSPIFDNHIGDYNICASAFQRMVSPNFHIVPPALLWFFTIAICFSRADTAFLYTKNV